MGWVDEVHGKGAIEEAGFVPTRHELLQLLQYWYERISETSFFQFYYSQVGSAENNVVDFAKRRISRIEQVLGHDVVRGQLRRLDIRHHCRDNGGNRCERRSHLSVCEWTETMEINEQ